MTSSLFHYVCYLTILTMCFDEGDGRWKRMNRDEIDRKIEALKLMADKLQHEIDDYYYEDSNTDSNEKSFHHNQQENAHRNFEEPLGKHSYSTVFRNISNILNKTSITSRNTNNIVTSNEIENRGATETVEAPEVRTEFIPRSHTDETRWPKFEEILLAMGKKYDWKNDRWIKVKREPQEEGGTTVANEHVDRMDFISKHKFSYRTVKLNRVKTKRNIVIAVTAVR